MTIGSISTQLAIFDTIKQNFNTEKLDEFTTDTPFDKVGLDSIAFIKMIVALEEHYKFEFDDEKLLSSAFPTIGALIEYVETKLTSDDANVLLAEVDVKQ